MQPRRIYGSEPKFRTAMNRQITRADELLDEAEGVRNRLPKSSIGLSSQFDSFIAWHDWLKGAQRWSGNARGATRRYLSSQAGGAVPALFEPFPTQVGPEPIEDRVARAEIWLVNAAEGLRELRAAFGVRREVAAVAAAPARFEELHASGLVAAQVIDGYSKELLAPRTDKQVSDAIGAAKELTEATLRSALDRLGQAYDKGDDLPQLMKRWRTAVGTLAPPDPDGRAMLDKAQAALANLVTFLAEWRNAYGRGHGRPTYPPGLTVRHARLAADAAETSVRFIVTTMDDLQRLPPP